MSRRRNNKLGQNAHPGKQLPRKHPGQTKPLLRMVLEMRRDGTVIVEPEFDKSTIKHLDSLYTEADREDYDSEWSDDHKLAFLIWNLMDNILAQWEGHVAQEEVDAPVATIPHINEQPVRDIYDINDMESANPASKPKRER